MIKPFFTFAILIILFCSCNTYERLVFFQNPDNKTLPEIPAFELTFKPNDFLYIVVMCDDPESAIPFNFPLIENSSRQVNQGYRTGAPVRSGYRVSEEGFVNLPVIGKVSAIGKSRKQLSEELELRLNLYLNNPVVNIQIQNFRITVLGEVNSPGTISVPNEKISVIEAIGLAGDLTPNGVRKNVMVVREIENQKIQFILDLTKTSIFESPAYFLEQNDIVYISPNTAARYKSTLVPIVASTVLAVTSLLISTATLILR